MLFGFCSDLDFTTEVPFKLVKFKKGFSRESVDLATIQH